MIFKAVFISVGEFKKRVVSSANCDIWMFLFPSLVLSWIPIVCSELRILHVINSATKINSNEDIGHPWRIPRESLKGSDRQPLLIMHVLQLLQSVSIQFIKEFLKPE